MSLSNRDLFHFCIYLRIRKFSVGQMYGQQRNGHRDNHLFTRRHAWTNFRVASFSLWLSSCMSIAYETPHRSRWPKLKIAPTATHDAPRLQNGQPDATHTARHTVHGPRGKVRRDCHLSPYTSPVKQKVPARPIQSLGGPHNIIKKIYICSQLFL